MKIDRIIAYLLAGLLTMFFQPLPAQTIKGFVFERNDQNTRLPLTGVNIYWAGTTLGTVTDTEGNFTLDEKGIREGKLVFSLMGYRKDTLWIASASKRIDKEMQPDRLTLGEVVVTGRQDDSFVSKLNPRYTQVITTGELQRAACCNLAESFETSASVDVSFSDAITGAKQISLLGLSGLYSQIMTENIPLIRGLVSSYGLSYIPGPWMESIQVAKGSSSVAQGYESATGQINVEYKKPESSEKLFINAYGNSNLRVELNGNGTIHLNDKLSTMLLVHGSNLSHKADKNGDGFMDLPLSTTLMAMNRWDYINPGKYISRLAIKYLYEDRNGGEMTFDREQFGFDTTGISDGSKRYGVHINTHRVEGFWKNGVFIGPEGETSLGLIISGIHHNQNAFFGIDRYDGNEQLFYTNLILTTQFREHRHRISAGLSYSLDNYKEMYAQHQLTYLYQVTGDTSQGAWYNLIGDTVVNFNQDRNEQVAGAFFEYTLDFHDKFVMIAGVRADYNNLYGWLVTPRLHLRAQINENTSLRGSVGKAYRTANILAENLNLLMSQKKLHIAQDLEQEAAWNYGLNFSTEFTLFGRKADFAFDIYQTTFQKQVIVDIDSIPTDIFVYNLNGRSLAFSTQAQLTVRPLEGLSAMLAFRINDVRVTEGGVLKQKPLVNAYKGLLTLSYATKFEKWKFDLTGQVNGPSRLPNMKSLPADLRQDEYSPVWFNLLAQVTRKFRHFDVYIGGENLTNYRQADPIVEYWAPYHTYFDGSMVWGPVTGIMIYAGVRYTLK
ncbi:MAG: TonB-dependent receptor [Bacteroidales bacterium]|nr:TonB-dependent receptor [Bacteroidales bacterium]